MASVGQHTGGSVGDTTDAASYTQGTSWTTIVGDLITVIVSMTGTTATDWVLTDSQGGTYTRISAARVLRTTSADIADLYVRNTLITAAVATTLTISHASGTATGVAWTIARVSGITRAGPAAIRSTGHSDNQASGVTPTITLSQASVLGNPLISTLALAATTATVTVPTGWTAFATQPSYSTPSAISRTAFLAAGASGATSVTWGATTAAAGGFMAFEVDASYQVTPVVMPPPTSY